MDTLVRTSSGTQTAATVKSHRLEIEHRKSLSMTGVKDVPTFTDRQIIVKLDGETLTVTGFGLNVKNLDVENGKLSVTGTVTALKYSSQTSAKSILKKIFK